MLLLGFCCLRPALGQDLFLEQRLVDVGVASAVQGPAPSHDADAAARNVLWPKTWPKPDKTYYPELYQGNTTFVSEDSLPQFPAHAEVEVYYLTHPVYGWVGKLTNIWHAALGYRVRGGPSLLFQYAAQEFTAAVVYPDTKHEQPDPNSTGESLLHFPAAAFLDFRVDTTGQTFPDGSPGGVANYQLVGKTAGAGFNSFIRWAHRYAVEHPRYLVWRGLEPQSQRIVLESSECFDFAFAGLRFLRSTGVATITVSELPRTVVNLYAEEIEEMPFDAQISKFFSSKASVVAEWTHLSHLLPVPLMRLRKYWYWPAWYTAATKSGNSSTGRMLQNREFPGLYHRYMLSSPVSATMPATAPGVHRLQIPVFETFDTVLSF